MLKPHAREVRGRPAPGALRFFPGAARLSTGTGKPLLAILPFLAAAHLLAPGPSQAREFPTGSLGDIWFTVDHAGFLEGQELVEEYYIQVPNDRLEYQPLAGGGLAGRTKITLSFRNGDDDEVSSVDREFTFNVRDEAEAADPSSAQLFLVKEPFDPRARTVRVTVGDLNARKRGLLYLVTKRRRDGVASATLTPPAVREQGLSLSDLQFAWEVTNASPGAAFEKNGYNVVPNPSRAYGLLKPRMTAYYEIYDRRAGAPAADRRFAVESQIADASGEMLETHADSASYHGDTWASVVSFDLENRPTGVYSLAVRVRDLATGELAEQKRTFSMIWSERSWMSAESDVVNEARVLLTEQEFQRFVEMPSGERESYIDRFWKDHDPSPLSARNEVREEFEKRVLFTNTHFSSSVEKGMLSDRGRIYIRYGDPDEIRRELLPNRDENLENALDELQANESKARIVKGGQTEGRDSRPFEVWIYTTSGVPLFPEREYATSRSGLQFMFVDDLGLGNYVLRYSNDFNRY